MISKSSIGGLALMAIVAVAAGPAAANDSDYRIGPQDKLKIRVYDFRVGSGESHEWTALTGDFVVGASGNVSLPFVGELHAADLSTEQLAGAVAMGLQKKVGLAQPPFASVEVSQYRPFYILGRVDKPGEYPFRPGTTVLQALGIAGGMERFTQANLLASERDALVGRGDLRVLAAERIQLLVRQARLTAEINDAEAPAYPQEIQSQASDPAVARARREEDLLFASDRNSLSSQVLILRQTKDLLGHEVVALKTKDTSLDRQIALSRKEVDLVSGLVTKGLSVTPRQTALEQNEAQLESMRLDVQVAALRAQQDIAKADREILELGNKARAQALTETSEVRSRLASLDERIDTAKSLIYQAEVRAPQVDAAMAERDRAQVLFFATRPVGGVFKTEAIDENDLIRPGDTIRVEQAPVKAKTMDQAAR
jgi:exopolysaccharide production protein ExoF